MNEIHSGKIMGVTLLLFGLIESLIWLRVILKLMAANPAHGFVTFIYEVTSVLVWPFSNLVENPTGGGMVVEITSFITMIMYGLLCWVAIQLVLNARRKNKSQAVPVARKDS